MSEILLLNARKKRAKSRRRKTKTNSPRQKMTTRKTTRRKPRKTATKKVVKRKGAVTMAKKRTYKKRRATTKPRRNPTKRRKASRAITRRAGGAIAGLNFRSALTNIPISTAGMMAAKWAAKRFGGATETDPTSWTWASYLKGAAGAAGAGIVANMLRRGWGQKILEGGMSLMLYKLVQNELIPKSEWATGQFGQVNERVPGVVEENEAGEPFILGEDYQWYPLEASADDYRLPSYMGSELVEPGPLGFGDELVPVGPLGYSDSGQSFLRR